jgi:hypothetical protein
MYDDNLISSLGGVCISDTWKVKSFLIKLLIDVKVSLQ